MLDQLLNAYWLRPETAIWRSLDIKAMQGFEFESPSLDFGAGDGMFSFIRAGGEFSPEFDVFQVANLDKFFENVDVYDAFNGLSPVVTKRPDYQIDIAFDHKENLLKKAATLGLYKTCKIGDGNKQLPFDDDSFATIFSNIVYWLDEPEVVLKELRRILKPRGKICLMLPDKALPQFSFYNSLYVKTGNPEWKFLEKLDRGRLSDNIKQAKSTDEWGELIAAAGLKVHTHTMHIPKHIVQVWDIGLRPMFPVLMKMVQSVGKDKLSEIKAEWTATLKQFVEPLLEIDGQKAFHYYILTK